MFLLVSSERNNETTNIKHVLIFEYTFFLSQGET